MNGVDKPRYPVLVSTRNRKTQEIEDLLDEIRGIYGANSLQPYGNWDDATSVGFRVRGIPVTFSVLTDKSLPPRHFNIQIESYPPGDYLYHDPAVPLWNFLDLVKLVSGPEDKWPNMK